MERERDPRPAEDRDLYQSPDLVRHGTLEELTAGANGVKGQQATTDQQSTPPSS